ncbi:sigma-70 family RNA polymerase sigma factor [Paenibacillus sp. NPDC058071]|uniref:sigma-70 family RNA polymerase sigma factor n=1 Tax=Paenibacillus sp. NPDC058071 TaxID=3346326 RepID=UPI0036D7E23C
MTAWLRRMLEGDTNAFHEVYVRIHLHVYRTVYFLMQNKNEAEDVVNEVYAALFQALPGYDFSKPFKSWLNGIILRQTSSWKRRVWRKMKLSFKVERLMPFESPVHALPEDGVFRQESRYEMLELIDRLSMKLREVIVLRYYHESSFEEIASVLQIPVGTVKSRHHAAIHKLRGLLEAAKTERGTSVHVQ